MSDKTYDAFTAIAYIQNAVNPQYISPKYIESMDTIKNCISEQRQEIGSLNVALVDRCQDILRLDSRIAELEKQNEQMQFKLDSLCTCENNPQDERYMPVDKNCPVHGKR